MCHYHYVLCMHCYHYVFLILCYLYMILMRCYCYVTYALLPLHVTYVLLPLRVTFALLTLCVTYALLPLRYLCTVTYALLLYVLLMHYYVYVTYALLPLCLHNVCHTINLLRVTCLKKYHSLNVKNNTLLYLILNKKYAHITLLLVTYVTCNVSTPTLTTMNKILHT